MIVAIHQPNYAPWFGYFAKAASADVFVFLDDVQFSKNSYINRVQVDALGQAKWLTVPVSHKFGDPINAVRAADEGWRAAHLHALKTYYRDASSAKDVLAFLEKIYGALPGDNIAATNRALIEAVSVRLGVGPKFVTSSSFGVGELRGDDRLIEIVRRVDPSATYLSGKGGANYQDPAKFVAAGIGLTYASFVHPEYDQGHTTFVRGLSILDALFRLGFDGTAALLKASAHAGPG
jgi:hypothetical protein